MPIVSFNKFDLPQAFATNRSFFKITQDDEKVGLINMTCPHRGGPLTHAEDSGEYLICPWHKRKTKRINLEKMRMPVVTIDNNVLFVVDSKIVNVFHKIPELNHEGSCHVEFH